MSSGDAYHSPRKKKNLQSTCSRLKKQSSPNRNFELQAKTTKLVFVKKTVSSVCSSSMFVSFFFLIFVLILCIVPILFSTVQFVLLWQNCFVCARSVFHRISKFALLWLESSRMTLNRTNARKFFSLEGLDWVQRFRDWCARKSKKRTFPTLRLCCSLVFSSCHGCGQRMLVAWMSRPDSGCAGKHGRYRVGMDVATAAVLAAWTCRHG